MTRAASCRDVALGVSWPPSGPDSRLGGAKDRATALRTLAARPMRAGRHSSQRRSLWAVTRRPVGLARARREPARPAQGSVCPQPSRPARLPSCPVGSHVNGTLARSPGRVAESACVDTRDGKSRASQLGSCGLWPAEAPAGLLEGGNPTKPDRWISNNQFIVREASTARCRSANGSHVVARPRRILGDRRANCRSPTNQSPGNAPSSDANDLCDSLRRNRKCVSGAAQVAGGGWSPGRPGLAALRSLGAKSPRRPQECRGEGGLLRRFTPSRAWPRIWRPIPRRHFFARATG